MRRFSDGYLGGFQLWAVVDIAVSPWEMHLFGIPVPGYVGSVLSSGTAGSYANSAFNLGSNSQTVPTLLHPPTFVTSSPTCILPSFEGSTATPVSVRWVCMWCPPASPW